jgi:hypothetical protein
MAGLVPAIYFALSQPRCGCPDRVPFCANRVCCRGDYSASPASMRAQLRAPLRNDLRSYFSFGE